MKDLRGVARRMAHMILLGIHYQGEVLTPVPLDKVAKLLAVQVKHEERPEGFPRSTHGSVFPYYAREGYKIFGSKKLAAVGADMAIFDQDPCEAQQTIAHEFGHVLALTYFPYVDEGLSIHADSDREVFLEEFARRLILPDRLLLKCLDGRKSATISFPWIEIVSKALKVPYHTLLWRLNDAAREGVITLNNCGMLIEILPHLDGVARVTAAFTPPPWQISFFSELSSLGCPKLLATFLTQDTGSSIIKDVLRLDAGEKMVIVRELHYCFFVPSPDHPSKKSMLVLFRLY